jgi:N-acetyl-gamma-glutamyl-phosphate reductase
VIAGVIGATGYAGAEIVRLLLGHPGVDGLMLSSTSREGFCLTDVYPNFIKTPPGRVNINLGNADQVIAASDVVFAALPSGVSEPYAAACAARGCHFIDMSADFRFKSGALYSAWYGKTWTENALHEASIYGLSEFNRDRIQKAAALGAVVIGNPGCYPTGASLAAWPALSGGARAGAHAGAHAGACALADRGALIIDDAASGVTGGGRELARSFHFAECSDSMSAYKVGAHRHSPEIAVNFMLMEGMVGGLNGGLGTADTRPVIFTPHLAPMNRGILSTLYIPLAPNWKVKSAEGTFATMPPGKEIEDKAGEIRAGYTKF